MRTFWLAAACGTSIALSTALIVYPALATDQSTAVSMCSKNPNCLALRSGNGINIRVGANEVYCPDKGECVCLNCSPPRRVRGSGDDSVRGVLTDYFDEPDKARDRGGKPSGGRPAGGSPDGGTPN